MTKTEIKSRLAFRKEALEKLQKAYLAIIDGGVKSYAIDDRNLTRFDIPVLEDEIKTCENEIDTLTNMLNGGKARKAFAVIPRDW